MRYVFGLIATAVRIFLGFILLAVGIFCAVTFEFPAGADSAYVQGRLIGTLALTLIFGMVGFKMMTRRALH
jgi:hypothetical protein